jgi:hypothetical protein
MLGRPALSYAESYDDDTYDDFEGSKLKNFLIFL